MQGTIFDIQRFSVHDGPGIRTTVFLKGCPLRCQWCHNPEGLHAQIQLKYQKDLCIGCGLCGARETQEDAQRCPSGALSICGRHAAPEEVIREVMKDAAFYGADGGITLSGGECLLQPDFAADILRLAKAEGISTAVDTCGYVSWEAFEQVMDHCDLFLYDVKMMDRDKHKKYTGVYPELIHENLIRQSVGHFQLREVLILRQPPGCMKRTMPKCRACLLQRRILRKGVRYGQVGMVRRNLATLQRFCLRKRQYILRKRDATVFQRKAHFSACRNGYRPLGQPLRGNMVEGCIQHLVAGRRDDGVCLGVDRAAKLIALAAGDVHLLAEAVA